MRRSSARKRSGFSLVEVSIVLGVVGLVTAGIWTVMVSARESNLSNLLYQQVLMITRNVRDYFSGRQLPTTIADVGTNYTSVRLRAAGVFPDDVCPSNCVANSALTAYNAYGGGVGFGLPTTMTMTPQPNQFFLRMTSIKERGCIQLGLNLSAKATELGLISYKIDSYGDITSFPIQASLLTTQCSTAAAGSTVVVTMKIRNE